MSTSAPATMRCVAASHYFHKLGDSYPSLDARVNAITRERYRRIDRFVQLALLGAAECVAGRPLAEDCGLYLSSGFGPINSNVLVQDAIHRDSRLPMPFNFVNTLGSSACYHVVKELGLASEAVMVARGGASFSTALMCAYADLASGVVSQVLVGAVEECVLPGERHRALLRLDDDVVIAEGSHWVLLEPGEHSGTPLDDATLDTSDFDGYESADAARLTHFMTRHPGQSFGLQIDGQYNTRLTSL
jgi:Beta-ketoacyl synthase, N-terminal domain